MSVKSEWEGRWENFDNVKNIKEFQLSKEYQKVEFFHNVEKNSFEIRNEIGNLPKMLRKKCLKNLKKNIPKHLQNFKQIFLLWTHFFNVEEVPKILKEFFSR